MHTKTLADTRTHAWLAYLIAVERVALVAAIVMRRTPRSGRVGVSEKASIEAEMQARAARYGTMERISARRTPGQRTPTTRALERCLSLHPLEC